jgi:hypothetical protein
MQSARLASGAPCDNRTMPKPVSKTAVSKTAVKKAATKVDDTQTPPHGDVFQAQLPGRTPAQVSREAAMKAAKARWADKKRG